MLTSAEIPKSVLSVNSGPDSRRSYQALIHPYFNYCNTIGGNCGITLRNKLQKLQNRAARVWTFADYLKTLVTCLKYWEGKI